MAHLQRAGHRPIALVGGGTTRIGDPSGKTEMRKILPVETIAANAELFRRQIARFLDFSEGKALMLDNAEWLAPLNYIEFLRDIGRHFSVNRMLSFETYKMRMETGLSFIEFNYQILQCYDYLVLYRSHGCRLQMGGDDQWGNIVAGMDLIRRVEGAEAYALTSPLVGALRRQEDGQVREGRPVPGPGDDQPLRVLPVLGERAGCRRGAVPHAFHVPPVPEIKELCAVKDEKINEAKRRLALEITTLVHGATRRRRRRKRHGRPSSRRRGACRSFRGAVRRDPRAEVEKGIGVVDLFVRSTLCATKSDARRLISQGGAYVGRRNVTDVEAGDLR